MSLIDEALKAAQREKSRLDAESGRPLAPVLVRLRSQPRQRFGRSHMLGAAGALLTVIAAVFWFRAAAADAPLPNVPPVTSAILTEALASDTLRSQASMPSAARAPEIAPQRPVSAVRPDRPGGAETGPASAPPFSRMQPPPEPGPRETAPANLAVARADSSEPRPQQAGTLRIAVEQPRQADATRLFSEAIAAHRAQDYARARGLYEQVLALTPDDGDALNNLGVILSMEREFDRAQGLLRRAVVVAPRNAGAWNNLGHLLREQGRVDEAIAAFRQALAVDPQHHGARLGLAQQYLATHALPQARELLEDLLRGSPAFAEAHYTLGQVRELQGDRAGAIAAYAAFIRHAPPRLTAHAELVRQRIESLSAP